MNKWLFKYWYWLYFQFYKIRLDYYLLVGKKEKARKLVTEEFRWKN